MIPPEILDRIKSHFILTDYVMESGVVLNGPERDMVGLCPMPGHREKTPSFHVHPEYFKCHGCGKGGDIFAFMREVQNIQFMDAVKSLAHRAGIALPDQERPKTPEFNPLNYAHPRKTGPDGKPLMPAVFWTYRDHNSATFAYVSRFNKPDGSKDDVLPIRMVEGRWRYKGWKKGEELVPIYGLDVLARKPNHPVLVVEGEKACDAARKLFQQFAVISWQGGCPAHQRIDLKPLLDSLPAREGEVKVILWPDNDKPGRDAMSYLKARFGACARIINLKGYDFPQGWDLADEVPEGVNLQGLIDAAINPPPPEAAPPPPTTPFRCLGFDNGHFYYLSHASGLIVTLSHGQHTELDLQAIAPDEFWMDYAPGKSGPNYKTAAKRLFHEQYLSGAFFNHDNIRGLGCWVEPGFNGSPDLVVYHAGKHLYVNGVKTELHAHQSRYIYPRRTSIAIDISKVATVDDGQRLVEIISLLQWKNPEASAWRFTGLLTCACICGALDWRCHGWINGSSGIGKSWLYSNIIAPLLGLSVIKAQSSTTEAGIRQALECDALPVMVDEFEAKDERSRARVNGVLELIRQASSETGGTIYKGTTSGVSKQYRVRSTFILSSIAYGALEYADESRISKLEFEKIPDDKTRTEQFKKLEALTAEWIAKPGFCESIRARMITFAHRIRAAAELFRAAIAKATGDARLGQQLGSMASANWYLTADTDPTPEDIARFVMDYSLVDESIESKANGDDSSRCLDHLMQSKMDLIDVDGKRFPMSVSELLTMYWEDAPQRDHASDTLTRNGVYPRHNGIYVYNRHVELDRIFKGTQFAGNWKDHFIRLKGSVQKKFTPTCHRGGLGVFITKESIGLSKDD